MSNALAFQPAAFEEPMRFGPYQVVERIAEGGMGIIFRALDDRGGPPVAIKTVRSRRAADAAAIRREIVTLSLLRHPGIAERQMKRETVAPSHLIADVPSQLEDLVMSMLAKPPARRPDSAAEIGGRLANIARRAQQSSGAAIDLHLFGPRSEGGYGEGERAAQPGAGAPGDCPLARGGGGPRARTG